jgi:hypothetical protein
MSTTAKLSYSLSIRFSTKKQKNDTKARAKKMNRSINKHILSLIDADLEQSKKPIIKDEPIAG